MTRDVCGTAGIGNSSVTQFKGDALEKVMRALLKMLRSRRVLMLIEENQNTVVTIRLVQ